MTPKQEAAAIDPAYFKAERKQTRRFWGSLLIAIVAIIAATYAAVGTRQNSTEITQIQHSACQVDPAGRECQQAKRESSRAASIATTCIPFFKAGYPCPKPGSTAAQRQARRQGQAGSGSAQELNSGSDGEGAPSQGGVSPAPVHHGSTKTPATHHPAGHPPHESPSKGSDDEPGSAPVEQRAPQDSEGPSSGGGSSDEQSAPETRHESVLESAGATVGEVVNGAGHVVEAAGCGLASPLLCPSK